MYVVQMVNFLQSLVLQELENLLQIVCALHTHKADAPFVPPYPFNLVENSHQLSSTLHFFNSLHHYIVSQCYIRNIMQLTNHLHIAFSFYRSLIMLAYVNSALRLWRTNQFIIVPHRVHRTLAPLTFSLQINLFLSEVEGF